MLSLRPENASETESVKDWWNAHPFAFGVSNEKRDQVGTVPFSRMDRAYFDSIEKRFRKHHRFAAQKDGAPLLSNLIDYATLKGKKVLDIATGSGFAAVALAEGGAEVTAIDLTPFAVAHAQRNFASRNLVGTVLQADAQNLPFPDNSFDIVLAWGCLMHMPDTAEAIREIKRVLKPGGTTVAYMYNKRSWPFWFNIVILRGVFLLGLVRYGFNLTKLSSRYSDGYSEGGNPLTKFYDPEEVGEMFKASGFSESKAGPWQLPEEPDNWPLRSFPFFKFLPPWVKRKISYFGYGLIVEARK